MNKKVIVGDYFASQPNGSYVKHKQIRVNCFQEQIPTDGLNSSPVKIKQNNQDVSNKQQSQHTNSPRFKTNIQHQKQRLQSYSNKTSVVFSQNHRMSKSSHTETAVKQGLMKKPMKGILKRSLNSDNDFTNTIQGQNKPLLESIHHSDKDDGVIDRKQSAFMEKKYNDVLDGMKSVDSEISQHRLRNAEIPKISHSKHRRNNSSELSFPHQKPSWNNERFRKTQGFNSTKKLNQSQKRQLIDYENIQFSPEMRIYPRQHIKEQYIRSSHKNNHRKKRAMRHLTEAETLINQKTNQQIKNNKKVTSVSAFLNDNLSYGNHHDGYGLQYLDGYPSKFIEDEQMYIENQHQQTLQQVNQIKNKLQKIQEQMVQSQYRILHYQLQKQIQNKDRKLKYLHEQNQILRKGIIASQNSLLQNQYTQIRQNNENKSPYLKIFEQKAYFILSFLIMILIIQMATHSSGSCRAK